MRYPIKAVRERRGIKSNDVLALELAKAYPDIFGEEKPRSLSAKIGELDRGKTSWWRNRPQATESLMTYLKLEPEDLELTPKAGRHRLALASFPDFPAFDLQREPIWQIAEAKLSIERPTTMPSRYHTKPTLDFWLSTRSRPGMAPSSIQWLWIADEVEFDVLTRHLAAVSQHQVLQVRRLEDTIQRHIEQVTHLEPLIITVDYTASWEQVADLANARQDGPLLIIARQALPQAAVATQNPNEKSAPPGFKVEGWTWTLLPDWRSRLLGWIEQRMNRLQVDSQFSSGAAQDLLDTFDLAHQWFVQVDDVLVLCQTVSEGAEYALRSELDVHTETASLLKLLFSRDEAHLSQTQSLVKARWSHKQIPWSGDLPRHEWIQLTTGELKFEALLKQQIIEHRGHGYGFRRPVVIRLLLRSHLVELLTRGTLDSWALDCFDNDRRTLIDAALDTILDEDLNKIVRKLCYAWAPLYQGAGEAVFAAYGRRMLQACVSDQRVDFIRASAPLLTEFAKLLLPTLRRQRDFCWPISRPPTIPSEHLSWVSICWAWSLSVRPVTEGSWLFPGWGDQLPALPEWLNEYGRQYSPCSWVHLGRGLRDFLSLIRHWLQQLSPTFDQARCPPVFTAALLAEAATSRWNADPGWWYGVIGNPGAEAALLEQVMPDSNKDYAREALVLWPSLVRFRRQLHEASYTQSSEFGVRLLTRQSHAADFSPLLTRVMDCLDARPGEALSVLDAEDCLFLARHASALTVSFQRELLKFIGQHNDLRWAVFEVVGLLSQYSPQAAEGLVYLLNHPDLGKEAAGRLWEWAPVKAERLLREHRMSNTALTQNLLWKCPDAALDAALVVLRSQPTILGWEAWRQWALDRLPNARHHAPELLELIEAKPLTLIH